MSKWRIICVDDDDDTREAMAHVAMMYPHVMFYLHRSMGGVEHTLSLLARQGQTPTSVIVDISLEDGSGRALTVDIRRREFVYDKPNYIDIFWYTGWEFDLDDNHDPLTQTFYACGVKHLFKKPYAVTDLFERVFLMSGIPLNTPL